MKYRWKRRKDLGKRVGLLLESTSLPKVVVLTPEVHDDPRGFFMETYHARHYREQGVDVSFVQDNYSHSVQNTMRGLHYQIEHPQAKLVSVIWGEVFDVAVDIRVGSPTFGRWTGRHLSGENRKQLFIPEGFAHGFCVLSKSADFIYKCSDFYSPGDERGVSWTDPDIGIDWPVEAPRVSDRDAGLPLLKDISPEDLPVFRG